ncbi:hypothetical protein FHL15_006045 [Xylaria flabelliformis]|uniref:Adhesin domain-containing protein n=1 Tax=Xylaria flabelliformis TaxID=2512241 RepID=A0A553HYY6_9PEZI|nr:hypothetical protein FHL15_006045 [Xylaria flabelliformis]
MKFSRLLISLFFPASMTIAHKYIFPSEPQVPLAPPPLSQAPDSRRIIIQTSSRSISGSYPLYDLLSISTESGSISVDVTPHPASSEDPSQPASLEIKSRSGSVHATFSEGFFNSFVDRDDDPNTNYRGGYEKTAIQPGIPAREYITSVNTQSASISGTFPLGSRTSLDAQSGSIGVELVVVPVSRSGPRRLRTISHGGMQSVRVVHDNFWPMVKEAWWEGMVSEHESHSGLISVEYPDSWEGTIEVEAHSGSISVTGRGVEIVREWQGRMIARKGKAGGGKVIVRAWSGSVDLRFG